MSLEWFYRMENAVRLSLPDLCEEFDDFEILFDTDTTLNHPAFIFSVETVDTEDQFCIVHFDPIHQEFYAFHYEEESDLESKLLFANLDQMLVFIHTSFHEFIGDYDDDVDYDSDVDDMDEMDEEECDDEMDEYDIDVDETDDDYEEMEFIGGDMEEELENIEWITNDKHLHIEDHTNDQGTQYIIHMKLGRTLDTGDGVLFRNTITKQGDEESDEAIMFYFKEEEASYILDLINDYLNHS
ncbi:MAG TPA: hypothetical protein VNM45_21910 [Bacillus sp. (in: firmicutes)]|nr:hypothetical protein [Bacillus sp. (in: firmicutes)]